ncbi:MAG: hypothetical protein HOV80_20175 [Polyangiaceae bacterium]|nr:hypothetical protein [Polyangiaceae bacterium]
MKRALGWTAASLLTVFLPLSACGDDASGSGAASDTSSTSDDTSSASSVGGAGGGTTTGGEGGSGGAGGGGACVVSGLEQPDPACTACQDANCCLSASAAADDPGTWTNSAATICREANCWEECGVKEPECGGIVPSPASCADDLYALCCAEVTACAKSDSCTALIYICVDDQGCNPGSNCFDECSADFPGGEDLFYALLECFADVTCT